MFMRLHMQWHELRMRGQPPLAHDLEAGPSNAQNTLPSRASAQVLARISQGLNAAVDRSSIDEMLLMLFFTFKS
jgi:hypothetical protein